MKTRLFLFIGIRIIVLCVIGMLMTFVPDYLRDFFGDKRFIPNPDGWRTGDGGIDTEWVWGARHYWYFTMMFFLFVLSLVNVIVAIFKQTKKEYPNIEL